MKPGRQLDALIAEHVMGWKKISLNPPIRGLEWMWDKQEGNFYWECQKVPRYSTTIGLAMQVVEEVNGLLTLTANLRQPGDEEHAWEAWFEPYYDEWAVGSSPAHAICLAALVIKDVIKAEDVQKFSKMVSDEKT